MKIKTITIQDYMGIDSIAIQAGCFTLISGENAAGKTSILQAIKDAIGSGKDPSVIRKGKSRAEVVLSFEDGTTITMTVTPKGTYRKIADKEGKPVLQPAKFIKSIVDSLGIDPIHFITAAKKERLDALLESAPLRFTEDDWKILPDGASLEDPPLEVIEKARKSIFLDRTGINREAKSKAATAAQLRESLPELPESGDWKCTADELQREYLLIQKQFEQSSKDLASACHEKKAHIDEDFHKKIDELRAAADKEKAKAELDRNAALEELNSTINPKLNDCQERLSRARLMVEQQAKIEQTMEFIKEHEAKASELAAQAENCTKSIADLDALKIKLMSSIPIEGIEIIDDQILVDDIPFDMLNKTAQIKFALELAHLRAGDLPLILIDDAEHFDSINLEKLRKAISKSNLQVIAARVADSDLAIDGERKVE